MDKKFFNFNKLYTAEELSSVFELPLFVTRGSYTGDLKYKITSVGDTVRGEDWRGGRCVSTSRTYAPETTFRIYPRQKLTFRDPSKDEPKCFPVIVMATMSCGKSTLINSLLGKSVLPSRNSACTAKPYYIYDNDDPKTASVEITGKSGTCVYTENFAEVLDRANSDPDTEKIKIESQIKGVINTKRRLVLIDTPGTNNSLDGTHERITLDILDTAGTALVVYVINAEQMGINDDKRLMLKLAAAMKKNSALRAVFVINKADALDTEKNETLEDFMLEVKKYISVECGIKSPDVIPISALAALLFKKVLAGESLTRKERNAFKECMMLYKPEGLDLASYALTSDRLFASDTFEVAGEAYKARDIISALDRTGVPYLERYVQNAQIESERDSLKNQ